MLIMCRLKVFDKGFTDFKVSMIHSPASIKNTSGSMTSWRQYWVLHGKANSVAIFFFFPLGLVLCFTFLWGWHLTVILWTSDNIITLSRGRLESRNAEIIFLWPFLKTFYQYIITHRKWIARNAIGRQISRLNLNEHEAIYHGSLFRITGPLCWETPIGHFSAHMSQ